MPIRMTPPIEVAYIIEDINKHDGSFVGRVPETTRRATIVCNDQSDWFSVGFTYTFTAVLEFDKVRSRNVTAFPVNPGDSTRVINDKVRIWRTLHYIAGGNVYGGLDLTPLRYLFSKTKVREYPKLMEYAKDRILSAARRSAQIHLQRLEERVVTGWDDYNEEGLEYALKWLDYFRESAPEMSARLEELRRLFKIM